VACECRQAFTRASSAIGGAHLFFAVEGPGRDLLREISTTAPAATYMPQKIRHIVQGLLNGEHFNVENSLRIQVRLLLM
jgi:hypothetical protein